MQFDDFLSVLDLLQNPAKYAAQIDSLTQRHEEIKTSIEHLNARVDVAVTKEQADQMVVDASTTLSDAKEQASKIVTEAQRSFDSRLADLQVRETAAEQAIQVYQNAKLQWAERKAEHMAKEAQIVEAQRKLIADQEALRTKQLEVDDRLNKLRQVMG